MELENEDLQALTSIKHRLVKTKDFESIVRFVRRCYQCTNNADLSLCVYRITFGDKLLTSAEHLLDTLNHMQHLPITFVQLQQIVTMYHACCDVEEMMGIDCSNWNAFPLDPIFANMFQAVHSLMKQFLHIVVDCDSIMISTEYPDMQNSNMYLLSNFVSNMFFLEIANQHSTQNYFSKALEYCNLAFAIEINKKTLLSLCHLAATVLAAFSYFGLVPRFTNVDAMNDVTKMAYTICENHINDVKSATLSKSKSTKFEAFNVFCETIDALAAISATQKTPLTHENKAYRHKMNFVLQDITHNNFYDGLAKSNKEKTDIIVVCSNAKRSLNASYRQKLMQRLTNRYETDTESLHFVQRFSGLSNTLITEKDLHLLSKHPLRLNTQAWLALNLRAPVDDSEEDC